MIPVIKELDRRGWLNKLWTTRMGRERGGKPFTKTSLHKLLTNITYIAGDLAAGSSVSWPMLCGKHWTIWPNRPNCRR